MAINITGPLYEDEKFQQGQRIFVNPSYSDRLAITQASRVPTPWEAIRGVAETMSTLGNTAIGFLGESRLRDKQGDERWDILQKKLRNLAPEARSAFLEGELLAGNYTKEQIMAAGVQPHELDPIFEGIRSRYPDRYKDLAANGPPSIPDSVEGQVARTKEVEAEKEERAVLEETKEAVDQIDPSVRANTEMEAAQNVLHSIMLDEQELPQVVADRKAQDPLLPRSDADEFELRSSGERFQNSLRSYMADREWLAAIQDRDLPTWDSEYQALSYVRKEEAQEAMDDLLLKKYSIIPPGTKEHLTMENLHAIIRHSISNLPGMRKHISDTDYDRDAKIVNSIPAKAKFLITSMFGENMMSSMGQYYAATVTGINADSDREFRKQESALDRQHEAWKVGEQFKIEQQKINQMSRQIGISERDLMHRIENDTLDIQVRREQLGLSAIDTVSRMRIAESQIEGNVLNNRAGLAALYSTMEQYKRENPGHAAYIKSLRDTLDSLTKAHKDLLTADPHQRAELESRIMVISHQLAKETREIGGISFVDESTGEKKVLTDPIEILSLFGERAGLGSSNSLADTLGRIEGLLPRSSGEGGELKVNSAPVVITNPKRRLLLSKFAEANPHINSKKEFVEAIQTWYPSYMEKSGGRVPPGLLVADDPKEWNDMFRYYGSIVTRR